MSLVLDTGTMKYRQNPNQPWRPLVIKAGMNWESMADTYDPDNGIYEVGQYVLEEGMMYRCISEITTPEAWTPAHWTSVNVGDELSSFIIISDDQPTDETNKIWIAETTAPFGVQIPTMDDHNALGSALTKVIPILPGSTNNLGYTLNVGDYFEAGGVLYKVTTAIPNTEAWANKASALSTTSVNDLKNSIGSNLKIVTSMPYTAEYSGTLVVYILAGTATSGYQEFAISDGTYTFAFTEYFPAWSGRSVFIPVIKGRTYTFSTSASCYVYTETNQTFLIY